jgi:probable blue pigment (indigoidine) exporter
VNVTRRPSAQMLVVLAAASWGLGTVMTKVTLAQLAPLDLLGLELLVGTAVVWAALMLRGGPTGLAGWRRFAVLGLLEPGLSFALFDFGLDRTGAVDGALLIAAESVFAVVLAWLLLSERVGPRVALAVGVGFAGSVLVALGESGKGASLLGDVLVLAASASAAGYGVAARRVGSDGGSDPLTVTGVQLLAATIVSLPLVAFGAAGGHSHLQSADAGHLLAGVATGLAGTAVPFLLYNVAIRDIEVTEAALTLNLIPVFAVVLAITLLGEHPSWLELVGGGAIIAAALTAQSGEPMPKEPAAGV